MFVRKFILFEKKVVMKIFKIFRVTIQEPPSCGTKQPYFEEWETDSLLRKEKRVQIK
jgi:hypothetical protein